MRLALASDHAGFEYKSIILRWLGEQNYETQDYGCFSSDSVDYPDYAYIAAEAIQKGKADFGIFICGTGIGISIAANKISGIRAANCCNTEMAKLAREHNNANVLAFGARLISVETAKELITAFLNAEFQGGRHQIRVDKLNAK